MSSKHKSYTIRKLHIRIRIGDRTYARQTNELSYYIRNTGVYHISMYTFQNESDWSNKLFVRNADDNGKTWSNSEGLKTKRQIGDKWVRRIFMIGFMDTEKNILIVPKVELRDSSSNSWDTLKSWPVSCKLSSYGRKTFYQDSQIIVEEDEFNADHSMAGVWKGQNCAMLGDNGCDPIRVYIGEILVPNLINMMDAQQRGYFYSAVLIGNWNKNNICQAQGGMFRCQDSKVMLTCIDY